MILAGPDEPLHTSSNSACGDYVENAFYALPFHWAVLELSLNGWVQYQCCTVKVPWLLIKRHLERHHTWLYDELIIHRYIRRILQKSVASQAYSVLRICTKLLQQPNKKSKEPKLVMFLGFRTKCIHFKHGQQNALPFGLAIQNPFEKVGNKQCSRTLIFLLSGLRRFDVLVSNSPPHPHPPLSRLCFMCS